MEYRPFGNTSLKASVIGLGCSRLGGNLSQGNRKEAVKMLHFALDSGVNFYDTADSYGQGQSEILLGKTLKSHREQVILATKAGYFLSPLGKVAAKFKPIVKPVARSLRAVKSSPGKANSLSNVRSSLLRQNFNQRYIIKAVEKSLKRLQTDYLDLFQLHSPPTDILQTTEIWQTLETLKQQGKIRYYGVSCDTVEDAFICLQQPNLSSLQLEINALKQDAITQILPLAKQNNVAIIARQPFASGQLSTKRRQEKRNLFQTALQFVLQQEGVSVVIPGASSCQHLKSNLDSLKATPLSAEELKLFLTHIQAQTYDY
ncbi:aldo/keto reductase [Halothece sp. PCC 7418]|uniref:aldo/keto reductase n=1 Tax=Halothece sp. (strain PCC 7418) TaxID=65093 RepID=UPI0002A06A08|nr:aldo/keto reductase [Halothece sp. PCC 7418]AFZ44030.1 aldo/keto reductase [Halothece sp. PCC 7418]